MCMSDNYFITDWNIAEESTADPVGTVFAPVDFAGVAGETTDWACERLTTDALVLWEQVNEHRVVDTIYDSNNPGVIMDGYELIDDPDSLVFRIIITVSPATAIMTRCTVSEEGKTTLSSSAMIYEIGMLLTDNPMVMMCGNDIWYTMAMIYGNDILRNDSFKLFIVEK